MPYDHAGGRSLFIILEYLITTNLVESLPTSSEHRQDFFEAATKISTRAGDGKQGNYDGLRLTLSRSQRVDVRESAAGRPAR